MNIDQRIESLEKYDTNNEDIEESIDRIRQKVDQDVDLNEERIDITNNILILQKLCLFYEDLSNRNENTIDCSLMNTAFNDLSEPAEDFNKLVKFLAKHKNHFLNNEKAKEYLQYLRSKVKWLNNLIADSKEGKELNINFLKI